MKLRNKKTGEIREIKEILIDKMFTVISLAELNEDWEDYEEEEKEYYTLNSSGQIWTTECFDEESIKNMESIGNYFDTREEAEKAVEKLKAWKRVKGEIVGWSFSYDLDLNGCGFNDEDIVVGIKLPRNGSEEDLNLLFGGEE